MVTVYGHLKKKQKSYDITIWAFTWKDTNLIPIWAKIDRYKECDPLQIHTKNFRIPRQISEDHIEWGMLQEFCFYML